ncbi:alpha/beta hydrolase [Chryseobacterium indologenes]|uniref:alpha/beta fold hydrolase n=1 Tax=Chryseobacterium indologenes TaxID=253 RepID=UPI000F508021|nr:alpha/beta hydrolase [Chryseobacterium indologenes]AYZ37105.1 alpha/beta hydrolase [Chryseobacterium indologenes]MBF6645950.1 alpha/beta hydrolase [Chryseobacterium indologenes]MBU3048473.1 alpha/beta hydrolase [Chryseobacterium indologenes]MEB4760997.1 alpha/beta hydrolase [Chryseobacterium indologenes]QQQ70387.1 alpha/beta hydrolase [Chryseobacterium indologenes]
MTAVIRIKDVDLCYEIFGEEEQNTIVLISGLGSQMIRWENPFCEMLVSNGFRVIRFDNRDSGQSVFTAQSPIATDKNIEKMFSTPGEDDIPYPLMDMAKDVIELLDHLHIKKVHIAGRSMGGIIAQLLGVYYPERMLSITCIMSTSLNPLLPEPDPEIMGMMMKPGTDPNTQKETYIKERINFAEKISGSLYPLDADHERNMIEAELLRSQTKNGIIRQLLAMGSYPYNRDILKEITIPALIIHGTDDKIFHPDCGKDIADSIPNSEWLLIEGMGHSIPSGLYALIVERISNLISE